MIGHPSPRNLERIKSLDKMILKSKEQCFKDERREQVEQPMSINCTFRDESSLHRSKYSTVLDECQENIFSELQSPPLDDSHITQFGFSLHFVQFVGRIGRKLFVSMCTNNSL